MTDKIDKAFRSYCEEVIHPEASPNQIIETRRAFYAGAWIILCMLWDDKNIQALGEAHRECFEFVNNVEKGKA